MRIRPDSVMKRGSDHGSEPTRRDFFRTLGLGSAVGLGLPFDGDGSFLAARVSTNGVAADDYLFSPGLVYLSTATLGPCSRKVVEATARAWYQLETNPHAMAYVDGLTLAAAERTRHQAAEFLGCSVDEVVITRSTTDGMNAVAQGLGLSKGDRVITSDQEHPGGSMCWQYLARRVGVGIDVVPIPPGENDVGAVVDRLRAAITSNTRVISISHVLSSTGLRMPIAEIAALARSRGIYCVVDGAQGAGSIAVDVKALGCHAYATSGHKWLMGPKGTGLLYIANDAKEAIQPIQFHDGREYYSESSGVGNLPGAVGLGVAIETLAAIGMSVVESHNLDARNEIYAALKELRVGRVVSPAPGPLATPLVSFELPAAFDSQTLLKTLRDKHGIQVKMVPKQWLNGIRLSPHIFNTRDHVRALLTALRSELK